MAMVITGAKAFIRLSGDLIAFASGVSVTHENRLDEIPQLDSLEVAEYAENGHRCSIVINTIKLASDATIGGQPISNSAMSFHLDAADKKIQDIQLAELKTILLQAEMIIEIVEVVPVLDAAGNLVDVSEAPIYIGYGAKFEGGTGQLDARGLWQGTWNFKCRRGVGI